jgi:hypothetical protein
MEHFFKAQIAILASLFLTVPVGAAVLVQSAFDPQSVTAGEESAYTVTVTGTATESLRGAPPQVPGLSIGANASSSRRVNVVNGRVASSISYSWPVTAAREGSYTIPAYEVEVGGERCTVPAATLRVAKAGAEMDGAFAVELTAPETMYPGQVVEGTLTLALRGDLRLADSFSTKFGGDGLVADPLNPQLARQGSQQRSGATYGTVVIPVRITALNSPGQRVLSCDAASRIVVPGQGRRTALFDDDFGSMMSLPDPFDSLSAKTRAITGHGEAAVTVLPLPPGRPASFAGAVGKFTLSASAAAREAKVGEPVEITAVVSGRGDLNSLEPPSFAASPEWKSYPPASEVKTEDPLGLTGTKTFKFLATPLRPGKLDIPVLAFSYLDPDTGKYVELNAAPGSVTATGEALAAPAPARDEAPAKPKSPFHAIELLDSPALPSALLPPQKNRLFLAVQGLALLLFAGLIGMPLVRKGRAGGAQERRRAALLRQSAACRKKALAAVKRNDPALFFAEATQCLRLAYCAKHPERLPQTVSAADIAQSLEPEEEALARAASRIFTGADALKYAGVSVPVAELAGDLEKICAFLEK